jgi:hypothetical protein
VTEFTITVTTDHFVKQAYLTSAYDDADDYNDDNELQSRSQRANMLSNVLDVYSFDQTFRSQDVQTSSAGSSAVGDEDTALACNHIAGLGMFCEAINVGQTSDDQQDADSDIEDLDSFGEGSRAPIRTLAPIYDGESLDAMDEKYMTWQQTSTQDMAPQLMSAASVEASLNIAEAQPTHWWCPSVWGGKLERAVGSVDRHLVCSVLALIGAAFWLAAVMWSTKAVWAWCVRSDREGSDSFEIHEPLISSTACKDVCWRPVKVVSDGADKRALRLAF